MGETLLRSQALFDNQALTVKRAAPIKDAASVAIAAMPNPWIWREAPLLALDDPLAAAAPVGLAALVALGDELALAVVPLVALDDAADDVEVELPEGETVENGMFGSGLPAAG